MYLDLVGFHGVLSVLWKNGHEFSVTYNFSGLQLWPVLVKYVEIGSVTGRYRLSALYFMFIH